MPRATSANETKSSPDISQGEDDGPPISPLGAEIAFTAAAAAAATHEEEEEKGGDDGRRGRVGSGAMEVWDFERLGRTPLLAAAFEDYSRKALCHESVLFLSEVSR